MCAALAVMAAVYGASAIAKLSGPAAFRAYAAGLRETALVPDRLLARVAAVLAGCEAGVAAAAAVALALQFGTSRAAPPVATAALAAAAVLTANLALGIAVILRRGGSARCACFGSSSARPLGRIHLLRNVILLAVAAAGLIAAEISWARGSRAGSAAAATLFGTGAAAAAIAVVAGLALALLLIRVDEITGLFLPISSQADVASPAVSGHPASPPAATVTPAGRRSRPADGAHSGHLAAR
jgi:hypothetical protein